MRRAIALGQQILEALQLAGCGSQVPIKLDNEH
jgi:hypothetical protein